MSSLQPPPPLVRRKKFKHGSSVSTDSSDSSVSIGSQGRAGLSSLLPIPTGYISPAGILSPSDSSTGSSGLMFSSFSAFPSRENYAAAASGAVSAPTSLGTSGILPAFSIGESSVSSTSDPSGSSSTAVLESLTTSAFDSSSIPTALGAPGSTGSDLAASKYVPSDEIGIPLEDSSAEFSFIAELHKMSSSRAGSSTSSLSEFPAYQPTGQILSVAAAIEASLLAEASAPIPSAYVSTETLDSLTKSMDLDSFDNFEDQDSMLGLL